MGQLRNLLLPFLHEGVKKLHSVLVGKGFKNFDEEIHNVINSVIEIQLSHFLRKVRILWGDYGGIYHFSQDYFV